MTKAAAGKRKAERHSQGPRRRGGQGGFGAGAVSGAPAVRPTRTARALSSYALTTLLDRRPVDSRMLHVMDKQQASVARCKGCRQGSNRGAGRAHLLSRSKASHPDSRLRSSRRASRTRRRKRSQGGRPSLRRGGSKGASRARWRKRSEASCPRCRQGSSEWASRTHRRERSIANHQKCRRLGHDV